MKLPIRVSEYSKEPIYHQIESQIKALIVGGKLNPGSMLPSIRSLASDLACSVITTRRAYQNLEAEGFIETVQGKGTFVVELHHQTVDEAKKAIVAAEIEKLIDVGRQLGYDKDELLAMFNETIMQGWDEEEGERDA